MKTLWDSVSSVVKPNKQIELMIQEYQLRLLPEQAASNDSIKQYISREKGLDVRTIKAIRILKRS